MKCLLIMTFIFINGIENAEQKNRQSGTVLREDDLESKAKAWMLMVESGKADDEHVRKITPKSIFVSSILTSRSNKCSEGYRHDHLGECVKVIKVDQKTQLEIFLKKLSAMYAAKNSEQEGVSKPSNGPLHFSLPISGADSAISEENSTNDDALTTTAATTVVPSQLFNETKANGLNDTEEFEYSGSGALNDTGLEEGSGLEGSGWDSCCNETTETATLISEELDLTESQETTTEVSSTEVPYTTENDESTTFAVTEVSEPEETTETPVQESIKVHPSSTRIVFPEPTGIASPPTRQIRPNQGGNYQLWTSTYPYDMRKLPPQQLWWLPPNWRIDDQRKPAVFKFWSHLPLVHDPSFVGESGEKMRRPFFPGQPLDIYQPSTRIPGGFTTIKFEQPLRSTHRRGRTYPVRIG